MLNTGNSKERKIGLENMKGCTGVRRRFIYKGEPEPGTSPDVMPPGVSPDDDTFLSLFQEMNHKEYRSYLADKLKEIKNR